MPEYRQKIHFIGIGGTAMAGAALMAQELGFIVGGSDQNLYPPTVDELRENNIPYREGYAPENLGWGPDLVILGNAISRGNPELEEALDLRMRILSLPEFISQFVIANRKCYLVAGTHGKTTTTSLLAHVLNHSGIDTGFMIGGVCENFDRSARVGSAASFVIEGDEYDTSIFDPRPKFLSYRPTHVIINNIEFDHADIFADLADVEKAFARLVKIIPRNGVLVTNADNASCLKIAAGALTKLVTFGESTEAEYRLMGIETGAQTRLRCVRRDTEVTILSPLSGKHNALNVLAAFALLEHEGLSLDRLQSALDSFSGIRRRLQTRLQTPAVTVIEDFAHHPTAIRANLETLRALYPGRRLVVLIEPRSNTMVRNFFQNDLAEALSSADVIFSDAIYRAEKYSADERLDLPRLKVDLGKAGRECHLLPPAERAAFVVEKIHEHDVVCFMTNGSFGGLIDEVILKLNVPQKNAGPNPAGG